MPERPLLIFPTPQLAGRGDAGGGGPEKISRPTHSRQGQRVGPKLTALQAAFNARNAEIQPTPNGIDPSQALVIETVGSVEAFAKAVSKIDGLDWLGEFDLEEIAADGDVHRVNSKGQKQDGNLKGRLYLIMSNQAAMNQLLTLWTRYTRNPNIPWERGLTPLRDVFNKLHDIRRWDVQDRLLETGVLEVWQEDLQDSSRQSVRTEVELWYRPSASKRLAAEKEVEKLVQDAGGTVVKKSVIGEIAYQSLLVDLPREAIQGIVENPVTELVKCDEVMFFRPTGQMAVGKEAGEPEYFETSGGQATEFPTGDPCVAIFDGLPVENHELLADRLLVDDPDDLAPTYEVRHRVHGTGMASLVVWGDRTEGQPPLARPVYIRPILQPISVWHTLPHPECVSSNEIIVDLIHTAVRRLFETIGGEPPAAPTIKIINFSIGDPSRLFFQMLSPLARLLDWLSHKYQVLFVVSSGNHTGAIELGISETQFRQLPADERERLVVHKLYEDARNRRLLSPAESINALTVSAVHHDSPNHTIPPRLVECYSSRLPSPVSAFGSGYRRSVKPDVVVSGGRVLYAFELQPNTQIRCNSFNRPPGHEVASPGTGGDINKTVFSRGTSNAAALTSRMLAIAHDELLSLFAEQAPDVDTAPILGTLLKALLAHSCEWNSAGQQLSDHLVPLTDALNLKHWVSRWMGYGEPNLTRMLECTDQRATALGFGQLQDGEAHLFTFPLPQSLSAKKERRRLTVTLAWFSPVVPTNQRYRSAQMWFEVPDKRLTPDRSDAQWQAVRRGTLQHEVFFGEDAIGISEGDTIQIKVNCRVEAGSLSQPVQYGLAVSLEVAEGINLPIYNEVEARIRPTTEIRPRNPVSS